MIIRILTALFVISFLHVAEGQMTMHNFIVTDAHGKSHNLYNDYLSQDKVVVIKFFFTTCPPCIANAPFWQEKYVQYGSGGQKIEFFSVTTQSFDSNTSVASFEQTYSQTMKGIGKDGNAPQVVDPFKNGAYGSWWGTPSFAVISPNKTLTYPVFFSELDAAIEAAKTQVPAPTPTTTVNLQLLSNNFDIPEGHVKFYLKPQSASTPKIEIQKNNDGKYAFSYPSELYPEMANPEIVMESNGPAYTTKVSASDLLAMQKHILGLETLTPSYKLLAADVNSDGKVTASDILNIRKVILGLSDIFPNNTPSYKSIPEKLTVNPNPGATVPLDFTIVKIGNVN